MAQQRKEEQTSPGQPEEDSPANAQVREWDVSHGGWRESPIERMTMVVPAAARLATNLFGGSLLGSGYAVSKAFEGLGLGKTVDNPAFRGGFRAWMWSNGIFPTVEYEPLGDINGQTGSWGTSQPSAKDVTLTPIIISNHTSYLDGLILASVLGCPRIVAMAGSRNVPIVGNIMKDMDVLFVDRGSSSSRQATLDAIEGHCSSWSPGQRPLLIFPEGTTTNGEGLLEFKRGAFTAGVPVRPVVLVYTGNWDPASTTYRAKGAGLEEISDQEWAAQFLGHFVHSLHVRVLAPYIPSTAEREDPGLFARNCQEHVAAALTRVRAEVKERSWKERAGRSSGGLGYHFGDLTRTTARAARRGLQGFLAPRTRQSGHDGAERAPWWHSEGL